MTFIDGASLSLAVAGSILLFKRLDTILRAICPILSSLAIKEKLQAAPVRPGEAGSVSLRRQRSPSWSDLVLQRR